MKILPARFAFDIDAMNRRGSSRTISLTNARVNFLTAGQVGPGFTGHDDVKALAARQLRERVQPERLEPLLDGYARACDFAPRHVCGRIEIEDDDVGLIEMLGARAPDVQLEHADLREREQRSERRRASRTDPRLP